MEKNYRLPKEFTTKWLKALRSGKYKQAQETLGNKLDGYCCIGLAGRLCGVSDVAMSGKDVFGEGKRMAIASDEFPIELIGGSDDNDLVHNLVSMNDDGESFADIADWIEQNVELY